MSNQALSRKGTDPSKDKKFPRCQNKKQARMVCLNEHCPAYAFFCLECEDESCEVVHRHEDKSDKYVAISFKQFIRRVLKEKKPIQQLQGSVVHYRQTLERLRKDINEFVEKQLKSLDDIVNKTSAVPEDLQPTLKKLKEEKYEGLTGKEMDYLWRNCGESQESIKLQHETSEFIRIKDEELKAISEHFQNLNKLDIDKIEETIQSNNASDGRKSRPKEAPSGLSQQSSTKPGKGT